MKLLICAVLFVVAGAVVEAQNDDYGFPDYWSDDDNLFDYPIEDEDTKNIKEDTNIQQEDADKLVDDEIQELRQEIEALGDPDDYQIEDNRSNEKDNDEDEKEENVAEVMPDDSIVQNDEDLAVQPIEQNQDVNSIVENQEENEDTADNDYDAWEQLNPLSDNVAPLPIPDADEDKILEEAQNILNEDSDEFDDEAVDTEDRYNEDIEELQESQNADNQLNNEEVEENENQMNEGEVEENENQMNEGEVEENENQMNEGEVEETEINEEEVEDNENIEDLIVDENQELSEQDDSHKIIEETRQILKETDDFFGNIDENDQIIKSEEEVSNETEEEDTAQKVYEDLNADLDKLFETLDKLRDNNSEESQEENEKEDDVDEIKEYEDLFGRPYREGNVLAMRDDDYENIDDSNLSDIFKLNEDKDNEDKIKSNDKQESLDESLQNAEEEEEKNDNALVESNENQEYFDYEKFMDDTSSDDAKTEELEKTIKQIFFEEMKEPQPYGDDALVDETQPENEDAEEIDSFENKETNNTAAEQEQQNSVMVDDLTSSQFDDLMTQFVVAHSEDLDVHSDDFAKHVAPIHITLSIDEPTIITSPNYPSPYPTNNIIDWILEGPGTGIELNVTDFAVNGAMGDYVLVKPGGIDASGTDGLVFSYSLNTERKYRFTDVNRMFIRFESKLGMSFMRGFQFSARMIWPLAQDVDEEVPEPEAVIDPPAETMTVNLAMSLEEFAKMKQDFIEVLADMATAYILDHEINLGANTTLEVTQITRTTVCNIQWPDHNNCVEVTFGIPLQHDADEEPRLNAKDLNDMWIEYATHEQYAARLAELGITEFAIPDDSTILMVWLVIAFGVVISMAMLAFALWRFSCFEDYTRMKAYSDTDSIRNEKRHLDLYPTPHQTIPPLYAESDYKWADDSTRVDMGGFANKSYVRDELFDLDSDEDVITTRDRYSNV